MTCARAGVCLLFALGVGLPGAAGASPGLPERLADLRNVRLAPERAVVVASLRLDAGLATLRLSTGHLFPVVTADGSTSPELVFVGAGRLTAEAPDGVEAGQLEVFTGARSLDESVHDAVLSVGRAATVAALLKRPAATVPSTNLQQAQRAFARWRASRERELLGVEVGLLRAHLGEPGYEEFFAAALRTGHHGDLLYLVDPGPPEQVVAGQFVPLDLSARERRELERDLHREQRRGRFKGLDLGDLGHFDTWLAASSRAADGSLKPGNEPFEPTHYEIDLTLEQPQRQLTLRGRARITLRAVREGARTVELRHHREASISALRDEHGAQLPFTQHGQRVLAVLPGPLAAGAETRLEVEFAGPPFDRPERRKDPLRGEKFAWYLTDTLGWHPRTGSQDRATYDVTLHSVPGQDLVAQGTEVPSSGGGRRFVVERPTLGFGFEVGRFVHEATEVAGVPIDLYLDAVGHEAYRLNAADLLAAIRHSLPFFIEKLGKPPAERLTFVTSERDYSQSLFGFITLSSAMMARDYRRGFREDPREVIAHELAHQWWGHQAGLGGYRELWISEGMACYWATVALRERLGRRIELATRNSLFAWDVQLSLPLDDGRPLEALGPLVVGGRLDNSKAEAYAPLIYNKGGLVLDMIGNLVGEARFWQAQKQLLAETAGQPLTTEALVAGLERLTQEPLDSFARRFIYGTGLPQVDYDYRFEQDPKGGWWVRGTARQRAPQRYRYVARLRPDGTAWVERLAVPVSAVDHRSLLGVPLKIGVFDSSAEDTPAATSAERKRRARQVELQGNRGIDGRMLLRGPETTFQFHVEHEPRRVWLDFHQEVYASFSDTSQEPKLAGFVRGREAALTGDAVAAEAALRDALAAPAWTGAEPERRAGEKLLVSWAKILDVRILHELTRVHLATGRLEKAAARLNQADGVILSDLPEVYQHERRILRAQLALAQGQPERVEFLLREGPFSEPLSGREALAVRTVAVWQRQDWARFRELRGEAKGREIDLSALPAPGPQSGANP